MANLWTGNINTNGNFVKVEDLTDLTFTSGTTYTMQIQNAAYIREGETGEGFYISNSNMFQWTAGDDDLYIRTGSFGCVLNIAG